MGKKEYPLFLIDRSKRASHPFDVVCCTHETYGYIARVDYYESNVPDRRLGYACIYRELNRGCVALTAIHVQSERLMGSDEFEQKLGGFLNKGLKSYLYGDDVEMEGVGDLSIDDQIRQQRASIELIERGKDATIRRYDEATWRYNRDLAHATLQSLERLKDVLKGFGDLN